MLINIFKYLRSIIALCLVCFCISIPKFTYNQTLHAIIVGATKEDNRTLREGLNISIEDIGKELRLIRENTNLSIELHDLTDYSFNSIEVKNTINNLYCNNDDVIFFYYAGHGFRYSDQNNKWPVLAVGYDINSLKETYEHGISFDEIVKTLKSKNPGLLIAIAECCNSETSYAAPIVEDIKGQASLSFSIRIQERFKELYENSKGVIIASSSQPGQISKCSRRLGSYFTGSFVEIHKELTSISNNANWNDLLEKSKERTIRLAELNDFEQIPQFEINITTSRNHGFNWNGVINSNRNVFRETPNNFQYNNQYNYYQYPVARIVMFSNNRVFFLMSDNYIVEHEPYRGGLLLTGYRAFSAQPQRFQWDIVNPINYYNTVVFGVDYNGLIWTWNNYGMRWQNVGVVYY